MKIKEFAKLRNVETEKRGWGTFFDPKLLARVTDGTVSKVDIEDAKKALEGAKQRNNDAFLKPEKKTEADWSRIDRAFHDECTQWTMLEMIVEQYQAQPGWRSSIENAKDSITKWASRRPADNIKDFKG